MCCLRKKNIYISEYDSWLEDKQYSPAAAFGAARKLKKTKQTF